MTNKEIEGSAERRLMAKVILQAIEDLGRDVEEFIEDDDGNKVYDLEGNPVKVNLSKDAHRFLSKDSKTFAHICDQLDLRRDVLLKMIESDKNKIKLKLKLFSEN